MAEISACYAACGLAWASCYAAAGLVAGTITAGVGAPAAALACNAAEAACMSACVAPISGLLLLGLAGGTGAKILRSRGIVVSMLRVSEVGLVPASVPVIIPILACVGTIATVAFFLKKYKREQRHVGVTIVE